MIITAYLDESGTHDGSPVTVMSGFVGNVHQWRKAEGKQQRVLVEFGVKIFHAVDFFQKTGAFSRWPEQKRASFLAQIHAPINEHLEVGFNTIMVNADYEKYYLAGERPKKTPLDTKYGVCFRASVAFLYKVATEWKTPLWRFNKKRYMNIVMEDGHKNRGDVERLFRTFKEGADDLPLDFFKSLTFATKAECGPLLCADLMAYSAYLAETPGPSRDKKKIQMPRPDSLHYKGNHWRIQVGPESLKGLKQAVELREQKRMSGGNKSLKQP